MAVAVMMVIQNDMVVAMQEAYGIVVCNFLLIASGVHLANIQVPQQSHKCWSCVHTSKL